jgi:hypothetical protein
MTEQTFEVEKRALLTANQYDKLMNDLINRGCVFDSVVRVFIDFSALERTSTVSLRVDNGYAKLIVKSGALSDVVRSESTVGLKENQVENMLDVLALMNFKTGSLAVRTLNSCKIDSLEYSFRRVVSSKDIHAVIAYVLEIEGIGTRDNQAMVIDAVTKAFTSLGVTPITDDEWINTITRFHNEVNSRYDYSPHMVQEVLDIIEEAKELYVTA